MSKKAFIDYLNPELNLVPECVYYTNWRGFSMNYHVHPESPFEYNYVTKGTCSYFVDGIEYKLKPKDLFIINGAVPHKLVVNSDEPCLISGASCGMFSKKEGFLSINDLLITNSNIRDFFNSFENALLIHNATNIYSHVSSISKEFHNKNSQFYLNVLVNSLIIEATRLFENNNHNYLSYVDMAIDYILFNYYSITSIDDIATHVGLNKVYLQRIFKEATKRTIWSYILNVRLDKSIYFLANPDIPIGEIDELIGFNSRQSFYLLFKKAYGISPKDFRSRIFNNEVLPPRISELENL